MAAVITNASDAITYINTLYESDDSAPSSGDADFTVWLSLMNIAIALWENEEGMLWRELFSTLAAAADGTKTTSASTTSYTLPSNFRYPASAYVWLGSGTNKTAYKVIPIESVHLYENDSSNWCYFTTTTLEFNPNLASGITASRTISYNYYKFATKLASGSSTFEMSDPFFAIYYAVSELKKDEGDTSAMAVASQKLEAMRTKNSMSTWYQDSKTTSPEDEGFGI